MGGLIGAAVAKSGFAVLIADKILQTIMFIFISPALGFLLGSSIMLIVGWIFYRTAPAKVDRWFRRLQLISAAMYSLGHGGNDAQKTMGIIWLILLAGGVVGANEELPLWVGYSCFSAIALGTLFGGWRIVKTMGQKLCKLKPVSGFAAETGGAITLFTATAMGIPVSTTHTITGAIMGAGSTMKASSVRWGLAGNIVWAWIFTIPASALIAAVSWWVASKLF
jgi:PiT family inorganic phosphate transporter